MRSRSILVNVLLLGALVASGVAIHRANAALERFETAEKFTGEVGPLPDGKVIRVLSLGFDRLVADLFWLRTVYYIGDERSHLVGYPDAHRLAALVTDIDPYFTTAYVVMNSVLATLRDTPDDAIALLEKGIEFNDGYWRLYFLQGFNYFFGKNDFERAAHHMQEAAMRGGPEYLPLLVTRLYVEAGNPDTAIAFIDARIREAESPKVRDELVERRRNLVISRDLARINRAIEQYRTAHGEPPPDVASLVQAGYLPEEPVDPDGNEYRIRNGQAESVLEHEDLRVRRQGSV
jgi:tetratricopeptide (TPR) repeat protein